MNKTFLRHPQKQWLESHHISNVCRCIPNWEIVFLVIAAWIFVSISSQSQFKLSFIYLLNPMVLSPCSYSPHPPNVVSDFPNILLFSETRWFCVWTCDSRFSLPRKLADRKEHLLIITPCDISCRRSAINMHAVTSERSCSETPTINNCIEECQVATLLTRTLRSIKLHSYW